MPIFDNDGTTSYEWSYLADHNGTTAQQWQSVYDNDGTTSTLIYSATVTVTDLVNWGGWSVGSGGRVVGGSEVNYISSAAGYCLYGPQPSVGYNNPGAIYQYINLIAGHKYWVHAGAQGYGSLQSMYISLPGYVTSVVGVNYSAIYMAPSSQSFGVQLASTTLSSDYSRACFCDIIDLTAAFGNSYGGMNDSQLLAWCQANCFAMNGTKTINL